VTNVQKKAEAEIKTITEKTVARLKVLQDRLCRDWGTDVYTSDSHLATTAVHAGVLRVAQKGIVTLTILPGQASYEATTRNGVTSYAWGGWGISFKVERVLAPAAAGAKK
jgi:hypothetical protein